jgi:hypothetical protein
MYAAVLNVVYKPDCNIKKDMKGETLYLRLVYTFCCRIIFFLLTLHLTLILTAWEFKKPFLVKIKISPGWLKQNIC